jgi:hypothetical protein
LAVIYADVIEWQRWRKAPPGYLPIKPPSDPRNLIHRCRRLGFDVQALERPGGAGLTRDPEMAMKNIASLAQEQSQLLREQVIDLDRPGAVLHDFRVVLDYLGADGVPAAGKHNLLPMAAVNELDAKLRCPLRLEQKLKRPQLRSHPYLQGLHLLLRATGLARVTGTGAQARLVLDGAPLDQWNRLNPTEQYFNLLEAWLVHGRPEMIGERGRAFDPFLTNLLHAWRSLPAKGKRFYLDRPQDVYLYGIGRDFYHFALADLFGLLEVEHPSRPVQPWCPAGVKHTPFGDAALTLLWEWHDSDEGLNWIVRGEGKAGGASPFGFWQPLFQPYFPAWQNNLVLAEEQPREGTFVFRVSLGKMWRRIAAPASATLDDLVAAILKAVDFDFDHLYEFTYRDRFGTTARVGDSDDKEGPYAHEVRVGELPLELGQAMDLHYDFGDDWHFEVKLERIDPPTPRLKSPKLLEKHGEAPEQYPYWEE